MKNHQGEWRFDANKTANERAKSAATTGGRRRECKKSHSFWHRYCHWFSLFYGVKIMRLWSPRCAQWNDTIFEPPLARARPRPPAGYAPPLLDKYAPSQHSQYRIQLRLIVFSAGTGVKERQSSVVCSRVRDIMLVRTTSIRESRSRRCDGSKSVYNDN